MKFILPKAKLSPQRISGFTLVELLIVMAIIGVLATFFIGSYTGVQKKARDANRKSDLTQISKALEIYYNDHRRYPAELSGKIAGCPSTGPTACDWDNTDQFTDGETVYYKTIPGDPHYPAAVYVYRSDSGGTYYKLYARLENSEDPDIILGLSESGCTGQCNFAITSGNAVP
jgi:general secretion pathway protein G